MTVNQLTGFYMITCKSLKPSFSVKDHACSTSAKFLEKLPPDTRIYVYTSGRKMFRMYCINDLLITKKIIES